MTEFVAVGLSIAILLVLWRSHWNYRALPELPAIDNQEPPDLTVIIPARNEAHQIARAIASFPDVPVIVVDDHSTDNTIVVARAAGARVIAAPPLPAGAKGKPNACSAAAAQVGTKWILFVDADTWYDKHFAASIVNYAFEENLQLVTAFLKQMCETLAENLLLPYAFALYFCGVSAAKVNRAQSSEALANGQCLLFESAAYESMNGHASVIDSVIEDVAIAAEAKRHRIRIRVVRAEHLGSVRMYDSFAAIWKGFQKNSFAFLTVNPGTGVQVMLASILLTSWAPVLLCALRDLPAGFDWRDLIIPPVTLLVLAPFIGLWPWYQGWRILIAPFSIYVFQLIALNAMLSKLLGFKTVWKERRV